MAARKHVFRLGLGGAAGSGTTPGQRAPTAGQPAGPTTSASSGAGRTGATHQVAPRGTNQGQGQSRGGIPNQSRPANARGGNNPSSGTTGGNNQGQGQPRSGVAKQGRPANSQGVTNPPAATTGGNNHGQGQPRSGVTNQSRPANAQGVTNPSSASAGGASQGQGQPRGGVTNQGRTASAQGVTNPSSARSTSSTAQTRAPGGLVSQQQVINRTASPPGGRATPQGPRGKSRGDSRQVVNSPNAGNSAAGQQERNPAQAKSSQGQASQGQAMRANSGQQGTASTGTAPQGHQHGQVRQGPRQTTSGNHGNRETVSASASPAPGAGGSAVPAVYSQSRLRSTSGAQNANQTSAASSNSANVSNVAVAQTGVQRAPATASATPVSRSSSSGTNGRGTANIPTSNLPAAVRTTMANSQPQTVPAGNPKTKGRYKANVHIARPSGPQAAPGSAGPSGSSAGVQTRPAGNAQSRSRNHGNTSQPAGAGPAPVGVNTQNRPRNSSIAAASVTSGPRTAPEPTTSASAVPASSTSTGAGSSTNSNVTARATNAPVTSALSPSSEPRRQYQSRIQIQQATAGIAPNPGARPVSLVSDAIIGVNDERQLIDRPNLNLDVINSQGHDSALAPNTPPHTGPGGVNPSQGGNRPGPTEALPDILNSHLLPPYTPRPNQHRTPRTGGRGRGQGTRPGRRRPAHPTTQLEEDHKACCSHSCCVGCVTVVTTFRWVLVSLAMLGVCCVVTGIILGALHMTVGSSFLTLSLMFIGLGVMLVVVVGVGWRCTPPGHEPCHLLFNLGEHTHHSSGRPRPARTPRDRQWYGGSLYPEFQFRRPPPSYNASMQEFQQQLAMAQLQRNPGGDAGAAANDNQLDDTNEGDASDDYSLPSSPPPTYRSRASTVRPGLHITFPPTQGGDYPTSRPPTYRSHGTRSEPRPALPRDGSIAQQGQGQDNPACVEEVQVQVDSADSPQGAAPGSASSTLHRVQQVVGYLEGVLEAQNGSVSDIDGGAAGDSTANSDITADRMADTHL